MAGFNGLGTYVRFENWTNDAAAAIKIRADRMDIECDGFAAGLSTAICKDGQTTTTASIPFAAGLSVTGTATFPGSTQVSSTGLVGIGMAPVNVLDITQTQNAASRVSLANFNGSTAASGVFQAVNNIGSAAELIQLGSGFTTSGINIADGGQVIATGAGGLTVISQAAPMYLVIGTVQVGKVNNGNGVNSAQFFNSGNATPSGLYQKYTAAAPNGAGNEFLYLEDTGAVRATIRSNGGLANFSANNVNLSDIYVKPEFQKHTDIELVALETSFIAVDWGKFKYADQTHADWNYGYSAQGVEAAFALTVPTMTDVWNPTTTVEVDDGSGNKVQSNVATPVQDQLRAVYTEDLHNIAHALLARALKRISVLEARLATANIP